MTQSKPQPRPKLLVVEDDEGLQAQLKWAYEDFEVVIAGDRDSALAALRSDEPPVVTLDLGLPPDPDGTSEGLAVLDAIMALKPDTKVIVASGHGARESALTAIERGAYDFYQKPVDIDELGLIVRRASMPLTITERIILIAAASPIRAPATPTSAKPAARSADATSSGVST